MWIEGFLFFSQNTLYILYKISLDLPPNKLLKLSETAFLRCLDLCSFLAGSRRNGEDLCGLLPFGNPLQLYLLSCLPPQTSDRLWLCVAHPHLPCQPLSTPLGSSSVAVPALKHHVVCPRSFIACHSSWCYQPTSHPRLGRPDEVLGMPSLPPQPGCFESVTVVVLVGSLGGLRPAQRA